MALSGDQDGAVEVSCTPPLGRLTSGEEPEVLDRAQGDLSHGIPGTQAGVVHVDHDILFASGLSEGGDTAGP